MSTTSPQHHSVVAGWLASQRTNLERGIGLMVYRVKEPISHLLGAVDQDLAAATVILPPLTEELLSDASLVADLTRQAACAVTTRRPVLGSTPLAEAQLAGRVASDDEPAIVDATALVARAELAFLLERWCIARSAPSAYGAAYLTPIEARLAKALRDRGLEHRPQVAIGRYRADFLVADDQHREWLIVECDGAGFHDPARDAIRDGSLADDGYDVLRFSGSRIYRDAVACAAEVGEALKTRRPRPDRAIDAELTLSDAQRRAAEHREGPARVAAPAGSGKTRVIEARVRHLIRSGVDPARICAISFTNKAVDEMRSRLSDIADEVHFTTLHAYAKG